MCSLLLAPTKITLFFPSLWPRGEHTRTLNWKESLLICFKNWSMLALSKKIFLLLSVWPGTKYTRALIWKKNSLIGFESYHGMVVPIPSDRQSRQRMLNTLLMVNIVTLYVRDSLEDKSMLITYFCLMYGEK